MVTPWPTRGEQSPGQGSWAEPSRGRSRGVPRHHTFGRRRHSSAISRDRSAPLSTCAWPATARRAPWLHQPHPVELVLLVHELPAASNDTVSTPCVSAW